MKKYISHIIITIISIIYTFAQGDLSGPSPRITVLNPLTSVYEPLDPFSNNTLRLEFTDHVTVRSEWTTIGSTDEYRIEEMAYNPKSYLPTAGTTVITPAMLGVPGAIIADGSTPDDQWGSVQQLASNGSTLEFFYFGEPRTEFIVSSNTIVSFDTTSYNPGDYSPWNLNVMGKIEPNANCGDNKDAILQIHDINATDSDALFDSYAFWAIGGGNNIGERFFTLGVHHMPMYNCGGDKGYATHQMIFYETTNIIEFHIQDKPLCMTWINGRQAFGLQNKTQTEGIAVPGLDNGSAPIQILDLNDGFYDGNFDPAYPVTPPKSYRFIPNGNLGTDPVFTWYSDYGTAAQAPYGANPHNPNITVTDQDLIALGVSTITYTAELVYTNFTDNSITSTHTTNVTFISTQSNEINGTTKIDVDTNGCDATDISFPKMLITTTNGTESFGTMTQNDGSYLLYANEGDFTTTLTTNLPAYYTATPSIQTNTFTGFDNTFTADFCVAPNQTINDVSITLIPTSQARPGFDTSYQIVYKNIGTTQLSGDVTLAFDDIKLSFLNATETVDIQTVNSLSFNYTALNPFETRTIDIEFNINTPTATQPVNIGDILNFTATINPIAGDYTTNDNVFTLNQTVIGSYDPNDITCLEGDEVLVADTDKYLHYVIRFQNKGTADAINIVVKNVLDTKLDWSTLELESTSHQNRPNIKNGNEIEFIFEGIHLPDETTNEPASHGFIAYKIKPKSNVVLGDVFLNQADIFFDYSEAVVTNIASTEIVNALAVNEVSLLDFSIYPTPTSNLLNIKSKTKITKIEIYSKLGQLVLINTNQNTIDISHLSKGLYFVKVEDVNGYFGIEKVIKK